MTMKVMGLLIVAAVLIAVAIKSRKKPTEEEPAKAEEEPKKQPFMRETRNILLQSLRELQCVPEDKEEEKYIYFTYQSENFAARYDDKSRFLHLIDGFWYSCDGADVDQVAKIKNIINDMNWHSTLNISYDYDNEGKMSIHTSYYMLCVEQMDFTKYLTLILQECFRVHNVFFRELARER